MTQLKRTASRIHSNRVRCRAFVRQRQTKNNLTHTFNDSNNAIKGIQFGGRQMHRKSDQSFNRLDNIDMFIYSSTCFAWLKMSLCKILCRSRNNFFFFFSFDISYFQTNLVKFNDLTTLPNFLVRPIRYKYICD